MQSCVHCLHSLKPKVPTLKFGHKFITSPVPSRLHSSAASKTYSLILASSPCLSSNSPSITSSFQQHRQLRFFSTPSLATTSSDSSSSYYDPSSAPANELSVGISPNCAQRINYLSQKQGKPMFLRLAVEGGGCAGFQYTFSLTDQKNADDREFELQGAKLLVDEISLPLVSGSSVDYVEEMVSASFRVTGNPNSQKSCGCGTSFEPKL